LLTHQVTCPAVTLDAYADEQALGPVRVLKLDIEGAEWLALQGARRLLASPNRPALLALELIRAHLERFGVAASVLVSALRGYGYTLFELATGPDGYALTPLVGDGAELREATLIALLEGTTTNWSADNHSR
jgi:hypothetical protein